MAKPGGLQAYQAPMTGGEKHISGMEVFRQQMFHKVTRATFPLCWPLASCPHAIVLTRYPAQEVARHKKTIKNMKSGLFSALFLPASRAVLPNSWALAARHLSAECPCRVGSTWPLLVAWSQACHCNRHAFCCLPFCHPTSLALPRLLPVSLPFSPPASDRHIVSAGTAQTWE